MGILAVGTLVIMGAVAYAHFREGLVASFTHCFAVLVAGMLALQAWPFATRELEPLVKDSFLAGFEDAIVLVVVFCLAMIVLRLAAKAVLKREFDFAPKVDQAGGVGFGLLTGYFVAGFLACILQTLPWHENFLGFKHDDDGFSNRVFPPDQVWLKIMHRSHRGTFSNGEDNTKVLQEFSKTFAKERRYTDKPAPSQPPPGAAPVTPPKDKKP